MKDLEQAIRERAYHLWIADGSPDGNSDAYWLNAQREILTASIEAASGDGAVSAGNDSVPATAKPAKKPKAASPRKSKRRAA